MCSVLFLVLKGRNDVDMGVSPWSGWHRDVKVPKGRHAVFKYYGHVVPSGLRQWLPTIHGLSPMATACRRFTASRIDVMLQNSISKTIQSYSSKLLDSVRALLQIIGIGRKRFHDFGVAFDSDNDRLFIDAIAAFRGGWQYLSTVR